MTIECPRCTTQNPDNNRFCGNCGEPLSSSATKGTSESWLRTQVSEVIEQHYKDQKIIEIETTEAIAERLLSWAKLLAFFVGIPVTALLLILAVLGVSKYSDFTAKMNEAQQLASQAKTKGESLAKDYDDLRTRYTNTKDLADKVDAVATQLDASIKQVAAVSDKVNAIGEKIGFTPTSKVSDETKNAIKAAFSKFKQYLHSLGYEETSDTINIDIRDEMPAGAIAYYEPSKKMMVIDSKYVNDPTNLYREYMHHVLYNDKDIATTSEELDKLWPYSGIESGLAWYFPCSFINNPNPDPGSTWDLTSKRGFKELKPNTGDAIINGTVVWGSVFWELRQTLGQNSAGQNVADKLLFDAWLKLSPNDVLTDRGATFVRKMIGIDPAHETQIRKIFSQRGLKL